MKKIAGIALIVIISVGAPVAWHYHSPLPFLPAFPFKSSAPAAELSSPEDQSQEPSVLPEPPLDALPGVDQPVPEAPPDDELFSLEAVEVPAQNMMASPDQLDPATAPPQTMVVPPPFPVLP